jgi:LysM repeat protein
MATAFMSPEEWLSQQKEEKTSFISPEEWLAQQKKQVESLEEMDEVAAGGKKPEAPELSLYSKISTLPTLAATQIMRPKTEEEKADLARVALNIPVGTAKLIYDVLDIAQSKFTDEEWGSDNFNSFVKKRLYDIGLDEDVVNSLVDKEGKIKKVNTTLGTAAEVASFFGSFAGARKLFGKASSYLGEATKSTAAATLTSQALSDPSYNTGNMLEDFLKDSENFKDGKIMVVADALSADPDDTIAMQRLKLLGEEPLFWALGFTGKRGIDAVSWAGNKSQEMFKKPISKLTASERGELTASFLDESRERIQLVSDEPLKIRVSGVEEEAVKVPATSWDRTKSFMSSTINRYFTSSGQFTKKAFDAFKGSEIAQRAWLSRAEFISGNLQRALDSVAASPKYKDQSQKVLEALNSDTSFLKGKKGERRINAFAKQFGLDKDVARSTLAARDIIDELSGKLDNVTLTKDVKKAVENNIGQYIRRSYRRYEDPNYTPAPEVLNKAEQYFTNVNKTKGMADDVAQARASEQIQEILGEGWNDSFSHFSNVKALNRKIFSKRKTDEELPEIIRELLGEINDPVESVLLSISKASKLYENMKFYSTFENLGLKGGYVLRNQDLPRGVDAGENIKIRNRDYVKIKGTNSTLDGKYTTKEMYDALTQRDEHFEFLSNNQLYQKFLTYKGLSQANKTVYSWTTNLRNISGGLQFGLANGLINPFKGGADTVKTIFAGIQKKGDAALVEKYNEYMGLGVINTNVRVNEFRKLIATGYEGDLKGIINSFESKLSDYGTAGTLIGKGVGKVGRGAEHFYLGVDDFYKINAYEQELATLKKAFPNEDIAVLREEAAEVVKNTFPNYDRVPPGVKALRELPFGNFISFPTEIIRTSANILRRASKEITSGNETLRNRGLKRLAGYTTSSGFWGSLGYGGAAALGWTDTQKEGADVLAETPWSKDAPKFFMMMDDKLVSLDTQFIDSYSAVKEPLLAFAREIEDGSLRGEALDERLFNASLEASKKLLKPYTDESMLTELFVDVGYAAINPTGQTPEGKSYFSDSQDWIDSSWAVVADAAMTMAPGFVDNIINQVKIEYDIPQRGGPEPRYVNRGAELLKNMTGLSFRDFDPETSLYFAGKQFLGDEKRTGSFTADWSKPSSKILEEHIKIEQSRFEHYQELYRKYQAGIKLYGPENVDIVVDAFKEAGVSDTDIDHIRFGLFRPRSLTFDRAYDVYRKTIDVDIDEPIYQALQKQIFEMSYTRLDEPFMDQLERLNKDKGGEVSNVPNTAKEPDERIDRMTGMPYNQQAGKAFIDEEDPIRRMFFGGGQISPENTYEQKFMERMNFARGSYVIKRGDTLSQISKNLGVDMDELARLNKIKDVDKIFAGKTLKVPEYLEEPKDEVEKDAQDFVDDVALAVTEKVFSSADLEKEIVEQRERAVPVLKNKIPKPITMAQATPEQRKYLSDYRTAAGGEGLEASFNYVRDIGSAWLKDRNETEELYRSGEITDLERGVRNVAGHISAASTPIVDLFSAISDATGVQKYIDKASEALSQTEAMEYLAELAEKNPRAARNIAATAQVVGIIPAAKIFERAFNRTAGVVRTEQKGFYDVGRTPLGKMAIVGTDFVRKVPGAVLDAVLPTRSKARRLSGLGSAKVLDELSEELVETTKTIKGVEQTVLAPKNTLKSQFASVLTGRYIAEQSREKLPKMIDKDSAISLANEYKFIDNWSDAEVSKQLFETMRRGGNLSKRVPTAIQKDALEHLSKVWKFDKDNTAVVIKRPDGPQNLGQEGFGTVTTASNLLRGIINKGAVSKTRTKTVDDVEVPVTYKSSHDRMIQFLNRKMVDDEWAKIKADPKDKRTKRSLKTSLPLKKTVDDITSQDFKDYLTHVGTKFEEGPGDFIYIKTSHVSAAKEIGGVNDFIAIDTKKGDVFTMISDKHDIGKDIDPIKGRSLVSVQPMISTNWKTFIETDFRRRNKKAEIDSAVSLAKSAGIEVTEETLKRLKKNVNAAVELNLDAIRKIHALGDIELQDIKDLGRRAGMTTQASLVFEDIDKEEPTSLLGRPGFSKGSEVEDPSMYRRDGSKKSAQGFLGPVKNNVEGGIMTEVSVGVEINGKEVEVPIMVPTLTKKEIETLANMKLEGNAKNIPKSIIRKAEKHALQRMEKGLSPFYQDGE